MPPDPGLPLAVRCRHQADRAYPHSKLGRQDKALTLLLTQVRSITRDLLAAEKARSTPLRDLAQRIGVRRG